MSKKSCKNAIPLELRRMTAKQWAARIRKVGERSRSKVANVVFFDFCQFTPMRDHQFFRKHLDDMEEIELWQLVKGLTAVGYTPEMIAAKVHAASIVYGLDGVEKRGSYDVVGGGR